MLAPATIPQPADAQRSQLDRVILDNWLAQRAETCPDRTAVIADGSRITYAELEAEATAAARRLAAAGVQPRRPVVLELRAGAASTSSCCTG